MLCGARSPESMPHKLAASVVCFSNDTPFPPPFPPFSNDAGVRLTRHPSGSLQQLARPCVLHARTFLPQFYTYARERVCWLVVRWQHTRRTPRRSVAGRAISSRDLGGQPRISTRRRQKETTRSQYEETHVWIYCTPTRLPDQFLPVPLDLLPGCFKAAGF